MTADFSRVRLNPLLDYAGVELKQGGVLLDADANELVALIDRRLRALASDTLGRATVSATTPDAFKITVAAGKLLIDRGRLYVDGLLAENHGAPSKAAAGREFDDLLAEPRYTAQVPYDSQPYLGGAAPALPGAGRHLVYLDVWQRELTHLEQPELVESALAVETSSRIQTAWQVRVLQGGSDIGCGTPDASIPGWSVLIAPSSGLLSTGTFDVAPTDDPCELPPTGGYRGLENQLYRVEIHSGGQPGAGATFKWSRENASVGSRVASIVADNALELQSLGRDDVLRINTGDWVEITDDLREFAQLGGEMRRVTVDEANRRISFTPALPAAMLPASYPDSSLASSRNLRVRRWDQRGKIFRTDASGTPVQVQDLNAAGTGGVIQVPAADTTLLLENGVTVSFDSTGSTGFRAGDYFVFAARTADASVEILDRSTPRGIHHHYARLGIWDVAAGTVTDCRHPWPPAGTGGDCHCTACVTPASHASGQLTIQGAVNRLRDSGGTICLHLGQYVLSEPVRIAGARALRLHGQGAASVIVASGTAFVIERSAAIAVEDLTVVTLARQAAIAVRTVVGLALRRLLLALYAGSDAKGAAIALSGIVLGASIDHNLLLAPDGVVALESSREKNASTLVTGLLRIDDNVFLCRDSAIKFDGAVGHVYQTRISGNQVLASKEAGISALGVALPGAAVQISHNQLDLHGPGIRCGTGAAWIDANLLRATGAGERQSAAAGIALVAGLDRNPASQAQVLDNQINGFAGAGIAVTAPFQDLNISTNRIGDCGNGIVMSGAASAAELAVDNNLLTNIGPVSASAGRQADLVAGIIVTTAETARVSGNTLRKIGLQPSQNQQFIAGIASFATPMLRIYGNQIEEVGPLGDWGGILAGIMIRPPYAQAEIMHNHVARDRGRIDTASGTMWYALRIDRSGAEGSHFSPYLAGYTLLPVDAARPLLMHSEHAWLYSEGARSAPGSSLSILGNVLIARGRAPAVEASASGEVLFNDNRCELRDGSAAVVLLDTPVAIINGNRVRGGEVSIRVPTPQAQVAAIGNITTAQISAPLKAEMAPLNLLG